jgi:hypothetical protein
MQPVRILSVDGGGVGGIIPAVVINRLVRAHPGLLRNTDIFAGTSTGGLIALALAKSPLEGNEELAVAERVCRMYRELAGTIFGRAMRRGFLGRCFFAKYRPDALRSAIIAFLGAPDLSLGDLHKPVVIPVTALERPYFRNGPRQHVPAGVSSRRRSGAPESRPEPSGPNSTGPGAAPAWTSRWARRPHRPTFQLTPSGKQAGPLSGGSGTGV